MSFLLLIATITVTSCDQLAALQNNKSRIAGDWYKLDGGFRSDEVYSFDEGIIERDGLSWGSYKFVHNDLIEVTIGSGLQDQTFDLDFPTEDRMVWSEIEHEKQVVRYEWERYFSEER